MEKVEVKKYIIDTGVEVKFRLNGFDYVHYRFATGLITEDEARSELKASLCPFTIKKMERLSRHLSP